LTIYPVKVLTATDGGCTCFILQNLQDDNNQATFMDHKHYI